MTKLPSRNTEPTADYASFRASTRASNSVIECRSRTGKIGREWLRARNSSKRKGPTIEVGGARDRRSVGQERAVEPGRGPKEGTDVVCFVKEGELPGFRERRENVDRHLSYKRSHRDRRRAETLARKTAAPRMGESRRKSMDTANN